MNAMVNIRDGELTGVLQSGWVWWPLCGPRLWKSMAGKGNGGKGGGLG